MRKDEYANLELDELIPMLCEIFAQIDVTYFILSIYETAFCALPYERASERTFAVACLAEWLVASTTKFWLTFSRVRFPMPAKHFC